MKKGFLASLSVLFFVPAMVLAERPMEVKYPTQTLDGTKWSISAITNEKTVMSNEKNLQQTLAFDAGQLQVEEPMKPVLGPSQYKLEIKDNRQSFTAEIISPAGERLRYKGAINSDQISGTVDIQRRDGKVVKYTFDGKKSI